MTDQTEPTPRERGRKTCRAALMSVISLHRRTDPLAAEVDGQLAQAVVAAVVAMMDLDGLRGYIDASAVNRAEVKLDEMHLWAQGITPFLAPPNLRPEDLNRERTRIPHGSIRCAQWDEEGRMVRLGLQLGEDGPGLWLEVSRQELGYHAAPHGPKSPVDFEKQVAQLMEERDAARRDLAKLAKRRPSKSDRMVQVLGEGFTLSADTAVELNEAPTVAAKLTVALRAAESHRERVQELEAGIQLAQDELAAGRDRQDAGRAEASRILREVL